MLLPVDIPPGIVRAGTAYAVKGRWYDGSLVRFFAGSTGPVGGWRKAKDQALTGRPCALFGWRSNPADYSLWLAVGTSQKLYVYNNTSFFDITPTAFVPGSETGLEGRGWGIGGWGLGPWGQGDNGIDGRRRPVDQWHFDAWGEYLVGCYTADGRLFEWQLDTGTDAAVIANAPTGCIGCFVTAERILVALGAGDDSRKVQWSDQEDNTVWTPAANNAAGDLLLTTDSAIVTGCRSRGENLIFTDVDVHRMTYIGAPFYYAIEQVSANCGIISANAKVSTNTFTFWMSQNGFFMYDGYVKDVPCDVHDYIFSDYNRIQQSKICLGHNGEFGEIWGFYPSADSDENDRYFVYNYREGHWTIGTLARTAWIDKGVWVDPLATTSTGYVYQHEYGVLAEAVDRGTAVNLTSGPIELGNGDQWMNVVQVIHDESEAVDALQLTFIGKPTPEGEEVTYGPYQLNSANGYTDVRASGRQLQIKLEEVDGVAWRLGTLRLDVRPGGRR